VELTVTPLSQDLAARLLAAECHRLKSEHRVLCDESCILLNLSIAEERLHDARPRGRGFYACTARSQELLDELRLCFEKKHDVARQLLALGEEHGALSQASVSVLGTMNTIQRMVITTALEPQDFKDGAVLIKEGEPRDAYFIIVQGQVSCTQRRDPPVRSRPRLWRRPSGAPQHAGAPARGRLSTWAPRHAGASARGRPGALPGKAKASLRGARPRAPPKAPGASRLRAQQPACYPGAHLARLPHRPDLDETVVKRDYLLTNQPCEFTVTAVGEVKVLVLHGARQQLADRRADEQVRQGEIEVELAKRLAKWRAHWSEVQLQRELEASRKAPPEPLTEPLHERRAQSRVPH